MKQNLIIQGTSSLIQSSNKNWDRKEGTPSQQSMDRRNANIKRSLALSNAWSALSITP